MKKILLFSVLLLLVNAVLAQIAPDKYWVQFSDKKNSPYTIHNPEPYLSQRALQRRANQHIKIDEYDLPVTSEYLSRLSQTGATILNVSKWLNGATIAVDNEEVLQAVMALPFVIATRACVSHEPRRIDKEVYDNKVVADYMPSFYGEAYNHIGTINGKPLHDAGFMGEGMMIAVMDGGFAGADTIRIFKSLREEGRLLGTRNFVRKDETIFKGSQHGTACLGLMAGYLPNEYVGTAPKASYYLFMTEDVDSENIIEEYNWVSAAELADSLGVDVCSTSLGYVDFDMEEWTHIYSDLDGATAPISRGATIACSRGMLCVNSAGNSGQKPFPYISAPADVEAVLTIGAVNDIGEIAPFSSIGPTFDLRVKPDIVAMGWGDRVVAYNGTYYNGSGTSYACPIIAGMTTCLWQARPYATPSEINDALRQTANMAQIPDFQYGYGLPDYVAAMNELPEKKEPESDNLITVCPNPSSGNIHILLEEALKVDIVVNDILGHKILTYEFNGLNHASLENKLNQLRAGVYIITARTENHHQTIRFVVL